MKDGTEYRTRNLSEGAFIIARGVPLARLEPSPQRFVWLVFPADARGIGYEFYRDGVASCRAFIRTLQDLRDRVRAVRG